MPKTRLLLVDDDRLILATLCKSLRAAGYEVEPADSGEAALALASAARFDLALLDMRMPGISGIEAARQLGTEHGLPAVILSAYDDAELVRQAIAEGVLGYVVKPVDGPRLVPAIEAALARARDLVALLETKTQLERALAGGRYTSIAIGILMERRKLPEQAAFEALRASARGQQRKLDDFCRELVQGQQQLNEI
jgi:two-component system, response regulator PdtaR